MPVSERRESNFSGLGIHEGFSTSNGCNALTKIATSIGTAAGYLQRSSSEDIKADAEQLLMESPERALIVAAAVGLLLGTVIRNRR